MLLAELEIRHSRAVAPTRRVALGRHWLPCDPPPGFGGLLLAGIVAANLDALDDDLWAELLRLLAEVEAGRRTPQPQLRHRFQTDVHGLDRSRHRLVAHGETVSFELDGHGRQVPQLLGAVYAAGGLSAGARPATFATIRRGLRWEGDAGPELFRFLSGDDAQGVHWRRFPTDERWALQILGFGPESEPTRNEVQSRFRNLLRVAHPDHGAADEGAGLRILELSEARRILLAG